MIWLLSVNDHNIRNLNAQLLQTLGPTALSLRVGRIAKLFYPDSGFQWRISLIPMVPLR
jgi:hypothetical protein